MPQPRTTSHGRIPVPERLPIGAEVHDGVGTSFRVWAPDRRRVQVVLEGPGGEPLRAIDLERDDEGYFAGVAEAATSGTLYRFRLDQDDTLYPDPASRFQPMGPHGPSQVIDPRAFEWADAGWPGLRLRGQVIEELHIGTLTPDGTWEAAAQRLPQIAEVGITAVELMPVVEFAGRFGWGYDGVDLFAPTHLYGGPDDFRRFVDAAHDLGLGVLLDVVYNHLGPDGNYLAAFAAAYFTDRYANEWGEAINFDGADAGPVREFFLANARYWIGEFHLDGLRLDATQAMHDRSHPHIVVEFGEAVRRAAAGRDALVIGENEPQEAWLARPAARGGAGLDALWNDDFHHAATVALTGRAEAYYTDYRGTPQELISAVREGFLYQGQRYAWQQKARGTPARDLAPACFVNFLENHDQVANSAGGERLRARSSPQEHRALTALLLLAPGTPMLFQGQEFGASAPFLYFADHTPELGASVARGRREFLRQFRSLDTERVQEVLPEPGDPATFEACRIDWREREAHAPLLALHHDLIRMRREQPAFRAQRRGVADGAVLGPEALAVRYATGSPDEDRLLAINLGAELPLDPAPEPLLAPPEHRRWRLTWSSEWPEYGGAGTPDIDPAEGWRLPGRTALVFAPEPDAAP